MLRDLRINLIFEGSSEIMHLFMAREAVDKHLEVAGTLVDPRQSAAEKRAALPRVAAFYARWYPALWLRGLAAPARFGELGPLAPHLRFVERSARRLARATFHGMLVFRAGMERRQAFLFRTVDIAMELFAMAAATTHAARLADGRYPEAERARELADLFCRNARRKVRRLFRDLWRNDDALKGRVAAAVMGDRHTWLERGILELGLPVSAFRPQPFARTEPAREPEPAPATRTQPRAITARRSWGGP
jgi:hypothetical protein